MCLEDCYPEINLGLQNYSHKPEVRYIHAKTLDSGEVYFHSTQNDHSVIINLHW